MENYLSIGEVAKIRNIDAQSLRYYEKIGILIPAYVNPENGYRYYSLEQLPILDMIILCINLDIPLKRLKEYFDDSGQFEFERLLNDGRKIAKEKTKKINSGIHSIDRALRHINEQKAFQGRKGYYTRYIPRHFIISIPCDESLDAKTYEKNLSLLLNLAKQKDFHASFLHGTISTYEDGKYLSSKMFLEVAPDKSSSIQSLPEGNYLCFQGLRNAHLDPSEIFAEKIIARKQTDVIVSSMSSATYKFDEVVMEFQTYD